MTGPNANSLRTLNGGWSYTWQGEGDAFVPQYNTILEAIQKRFKNVTYVPGVEYDNASGNWQSERMASTIFLMDPVVRAARLADVIIACVGENSYCETPGNMNDLNLSENQKELVRKLAATGKPVILVLNEGRPRIIGRPTTAATPWPPSSPATRTSPASSRSPIPSISTPSIPTTTRFPSTAR